MGVEKWEIINTFWKLYPCRRHRPGNDEITESEHNEIIVAIQNRLQSDGKGYRLKTDLTWEEYDLPPVPEPSDEEEISDSEAISILLGGDVEWHRKK